MTFTYGPILAADGRSVQGIFCPCTETTEKVVGAHRLQTLRKLGARALKTRTVDGACEEAAKVLAENPYDIAFAAIYLVHDTGTHAVPTSLVGFSPGAHPFHQRFRSRRVTVRRGRSPRCCNRGVPKRPQIFSRRACHYPEGPGLSRHPTRSCSPFWGRDTRASPTLPCSAWALAASSMTPTGCFSS